MLEVDAVVREALPNALYRVELLTEKRGSATAHAGGAPGLVRLRPGDEVVVALMPFDMTRGRIVRRR
jgi:translation initiation factor IF-1